MAELSARRDAVAQLLGAPWEGLPRDFTTDIPTHRAIWLLKASIGFDVAGRYGIGYSPKLDRVIIPIMDSGELVAFTARAVDTQPKYIARYKYGSSAVFTSLPDVRGLFDLVVMEDQLSTIRVGRYNLSRSLLGTSADGETAMALLKGIEDPHSIALWLDGDKAGKKGRDAVARRLGLLGLNVTKITTPKDPKLYTNREIQEILADARLRST